MVLISHFPEYNPCLTKEKQLLSSFQKQEKLYMKTQVITKKHILSTNESNQIQI